jgi:hypothetical protein
VAKRCIPIWLQDQFHTGKPARDRNILTFFVFLLIAAAIMAPPVDIQCSRLNSALRTLDIIINGISDAFPDDIIDGPLAQYFTGIDFDNEFPYETVDTQ